MPFLSIVRSPACDTLQAHPALLALDPEAAVLQIRQETPPRLVVRVGNVVAQHGLLAGDLADAGHGMLRNRERRGFYTTFRCRQDSALTVSVYSKPRSANDIAAPPPITKWSSTFTSTSASACFYEKEFVMRSRRPEHRF